MGLDNGFSGAFFSDGVTYAVIPAQAGILVGFGNCLKTICCSNFTKIPACAGMTAAGVSGCLKAQRPSETVSDGLFHLSRHTTLPITVALQTYRELIHPLKMF